MPRAKTGFKGRRRKNRVFRHAQGFSNGRGRHFGPMVEAVHKAWVYAYVGRKLRKRDFRRLWITRINAAARQNGLTYGQFMHGLKLAGVDLDRKVLADIAMHEGEAFKGIVAQAKSALPA